MNEKGSITMDSRTYHETQPILYDFSIVFKIVYTGWMWKYIISLYIMHNKMYFKIPRQNWVHYLVAH